MRLVQFFSWIFGVDGRNGMLEVGMVDRGAVFAYIEGADMSSAEVYVREACPFWFKRDICRLIQGLTGHTLHNESLRIERLLR